MRSRNLWIAEKTTFKSTRSAVYNIHRKTLLGIQIRAVRNTGWTNRTGTLFTVRKVLI